MSAEDQHDDMEVNKEQDSFGPGFHSESQTVHDSAQNDNENVATQEEQHSTQKFWKSGNDSESRVERPVKPLRLSTAALGPAPGQAQNTHLSVLPKLPLFRNNGSSENFVDTISQQLSIHVEQPVGSMSISPSSRDVVLAARKGLFIIDLENPYEPPRVLHHLTKWEVADVQWNPHFARENWIASTSNQKALIWNLAHSAPRAVEQVLHAHSRAISDINWSPFYPDLLATCSVDTFVHLWDLRTPKKPVNSFCAWTAAATVVKFNRNDEYTLASAHDTKVEIWDTRKGSSPFTNIKAHKQKINGIDWSRKHKNHIVTCSLDKKVKFWDIQEPDKAHNQILTKSPVWRARHTPFGHGILTMPQRTETTLYLWNRDKPSEAVCKFEGHTDTVKEFVWRVRGGNSDADADGRQYQLVTWSKDQHLRLWPINDKMLDAMDCKSTTPIQITPYPPTYDTTSFRDPAPMSQATTPSKAVSTLRVLAGNRLSTMTPFRTAMSSRAIGPMGSTGGFFRERRAQSPLVWMQGVRMAKPSGDLGLIDSASPQTVATEIAAAGQKFQNVKFEKVNVAGRSCTISLNSLRSTEGVSFMRLNIIFPHSYPKESPPTFEIQKSGMLSMATRAKIAANLDQVAAKHASRGLPCLEAIIRCLLGEDIRRDEVIDKDFDDSDDDDTLVNPLRKSKSGQTAAMDKKDQFVPFPCLCGAVFATNGKLVTFFSKLRAPHTNLSTQTLQTNSRGNPTIVKTSVSYTHPKTYASMGEYKAFSRLPRNNEGLAGTGIVADVDEQDDLWPISNVFSKPAGAKQELVRLTRKTAKDQPSFFTPIPQARSILYFKDISHLLPVSQRLAAVYTLNGDNVSEICEQNALQAKHLGRVDLYKIWKLAALILTLSVPMDPVTFESNRTEISKMNSHTHPGKLLDLMMRSTQAKQRRDSGLAFVPVIEDTFYQKVRWGTHPLGRALVEILFQYLIRHGDIQMLALLSCVLKDPFSNTIAVSGNIPPQAHAQSVGSTHSESPDYFNTRRASSMKIVPEPRTSLPQGSLTPISADFGRGRTRSAQAPVSPYLNRGSPSNLSMTSTFSMAQQQQQRRSSSFRFSGTGSTLPGVLHSPLTTTPSSLRESSSFSYNESHHGAALMQQGVMQNHADAATAAASGLGGAVNAGMGSIGTSALGGGLGLQTGVGSVGNGSVAGSTTTNHNKRESFASTLNGSPTILSRLSMGHFRRESGSPSSPSPVVTNYSDKGGMVTTIRQNGIKITKMNMNLFDEEESPMNIPLLDPANEAQYDTWRLLYAEMMFSWGLFEARAELLKFLTIKKDANLNANRVTSKMLLSANNNSGTNGGGNTSNNNNSSNGVQGSRETAAMVLDRILGTEKKGLQVFSRCYECDTRLLPNYKCDFCARMRSGIRCSLCHLTVRGQTSACLKCAHGGHASHMYDWFVTGKNRECPTGCGCECLASDGGWTGGLVVRSSASPVQFDESI